MRGNRRAFERTERRRRGGPRWRSATRARRRWRRARASGTRAQRTRERRARRHPCGKRARARGRRERRRRRGWRTWRTSVLDQTRCVGSGATARRGSGAATRRARVRERNRWRAGGLSRGAGDDASQEREGRPPLIGWTFVWAERTVCEPWKFYTKRTHARISHRNRRRTRRGGCDDGVRSVLPLHNDRLLTLLGGAPRRGALRATQRRPPTRIARRETTARARCPRAPRRPSAGWRKPASAPARTTPRATPRPVP